MISTDEDALICDLAETYHIYDYRSLPLKMVATFSVGLRDNSRIKMAIADVKYPLDTMLLAAVLDGINLRNWLMSNKAQEGVGKPQSMVNKLLGIVETEDGQDEETVAFDSAEAFEEMRRKILEGG